MRILVNASNLLVGGGVQKAVQFVLGCRLWGGDHSWRILLSPEAAAGLTDTEPRPDLEIETITPSPARLLAGRATRRRIRDIEREFAPDVVYSVAGPVYQRFAAPHAMGFTIGWLTHPTKLAWDSLPTPYSRAEFGLRLWYYEWWVRQAASWIMETRTAARGMSQRLGAAPSQLFVVPNSCSEYYFEARASGVAPHPVLAARSPDEQRLLVFTSYKPHKNLEIIPRVAAALRRLDPHTRVRFVFTLRDGPPWRRLKAQAEALGVGDMMLSVGFVPANAGPALYEACAGLFMPTVLETFTANYPEAMAMDRPIITSDLDFAHDVCGDAAEYFAPTDAEAAAAAIAAVIDDPVRRSRLVEAGRARLGHFGTGEERFRQTVEAVVQTATMRRES